MSIGAVGSFGGGCNFPSISEMRQNMFKKMDQDGDGAISKSECQTAADTMSKETGLSITADEMMSIFDLNQDGAITKAEQTEASPTWEQHMADLMDAAGMSRMGPPPPPPDAAGDLSELLSKIFAAMDTNGDGVVDQTEYNTAMTQIEGGLEGSTASDTSSSGTTSSSTTTASSTDTTTDTSSQNTLLALIQQFLENILTYEKQQNDYASSQGQGTTQGQATKSVNSYA